MTVTPPLVQEASISEQPTTLETISYIGPGAQLKIAREARRLSIEEVANRLHLTRTMILEIESDRYDRRLAFTFIRGYLRAYARLVRVSPEAILNAFDQLGLKEYRSDINSSKVPVTTWRVQETHVRWATYGIIVVLLTIMIGLAIWWFYQPPEQDNAPEDLIKLLNNVSSPEKRLQVPAEPQSVQGDLPAVNANSDMHTEESLMVAPKHEPIPATRSTLGVTSNSMHDSSAIHPSAESRTQVDGG